MKRRLCLLASLLCSGLAWSWPSDSVYQLKATLTDQQGQPLAWDAGQGHPVLVSMFYTSCEFVCPMLVEAARATETALSEAERARLRVVFVSFDPARDSVAVLASTARERGVDGTRWHLARTDPASVRKIAALLKFQYRALPNGDFNHSGELILLDAEGRIAARTSMLAGADERLLARLKPMLRPLP